jgi:hypothetical protein
LIDGVRWRVRAGAPWRDLPPEYGPWQTVYGLFRRWRRAGVWRAIPAALQTRADADGLIVWDVSVDSTVMRAHQHAAGARKEGDLQVEPPDTPAGGIEPDDHGSGRSRGGWTSRLHLACEQRAYLRRRRIKATIDQPRDQATIDIAAINIWLRHI